jgi:glycosyltransferase involved in cell wall biosynthesis
MEDMKSLARSLGVDSRVYFLGYREDIPILVRASIATILVSQQEGLPRSIMESLSLEVPVIGTNIRGIQDLLHDDCGMLVEVGDINALAKSMSWMLKNPEAARNMGKQGRIKMVHHDLNHVIDLHENLYAKAINQ